jgi:hypothetical protein
MVIGRVLVGEANFDVGIIRMRDAMSTLREAGGELIHSYALSLLTESYLRAREPEKGLAAHLQRANPAENIRHRRLSGGAR